MVILISNHNFIFIVYTHFYIQYFHIKKNSKVFFPKFQSFFCHFVSFLAISICFFFFFFSIWFFHYILFDVLHFFFIFFHFFHCFFLCFSFLFCYLTAFLFFFVCPFLIFRSITKFVFRYIEALNIPFLLLKGRSFYSKKNRKCTELIPPIILWIIIYLIKSWPTGTSHWDPKAYRSKHYKISISFLVTFFFFFGGQRSIPIYVS